MRVLVAATIDQPSGPSLIDFNPDGDFPYAILSHTWTNCEVLFGDIVNGTGAEKESFRKVRYSCEQALRDGLEYVWIDSCCIDKSSSAELSEAINSMYEWYFKAEVCYAHLENVPSNTKTADPESEFAHCRWFTRGWTLQELLAPGDLVFYSDDWTSLGEKASLSRPIAVITGIDEDILTGAKSLKSASIAKRMSWAAHRNTTRPEDIAYCLMGVFDVNMPMLYGEGSKAFLRLQEEIMKHSDDQSLFAWTDLDASPESQHGLLAKSPRNFIYSNSMIPYQDWEPRPPYSMTNRGLRIDLPLARLDNDIYVAALDCPAPPDYEDSTFLAVYLRKLSGGDQQYARVRAGQFAKVIKRGAMQRLYVRQDPMARPVESEGVFPLHILQLRAGPPPPLYRLLKTFAPPGEGPGKPTPNPIKSSRPVAHEWIPPQARRTFWESKAGGLVTATLLLVREDGERLVVLLGSAGKFEVGFDAIQLPPLKEPNDDPMQDVDLEALQTKFSPRQPGLPKELPCHRVDVAVSPLVHGSDKYYMIDLDVQACSTSSKVDDAIDDLVDKYQALSGQKNHSEPRAGSHLAQAKKGSGWRKIIGR